jgi:hypothetical protein
MEKYQQVYVSESVAFFSNDLKKKFNLNDYSDENKPSIFFGIYRLNDVNTLATHKSNRMVIWCGSDALKVDRFATKIKSLKNVKHIAISSFVKNSLLKHGIESVLIPVTPKKGEKCTLPRGENIYFYMGGGEDRHRKFYGGDIVDMLKVLLPYKIIEVTNKSYNEEDLKKIYESCFIGLRLTKHDGCSNTVCELGLMGRKCLHNGDIPNSIKYSNINDIINNIHLEYKNRHLDYSHITDEVYNYLNIGEDWLYV